jgi:hypothetical protein
MAFKSGGRKCKFESLENRQMMAGDVFASVHAGTLTIKGDNLSNGITITAGANPNEVVVTGINIGGSGTGVNGLVNTPVTLVNVTRNIKISMKRGNDTVNVNNLTVNGDLKIRTGRGLDTVSVNSSTICGDLKIKTSGGADEVNVVNTSVAGETDVRTGKDCDNVTMSGSDLGALDVFLNEDNDHLDISGTQVVTQTKLNGGKGINLFANENDSNFFGGIYSKTQLAG